MEYKFEVIVTVEELLPGLKELTDSLNKTMQSLTGKTMTIRGLLGEITVRSENALTSDVIELYRKKVEDFFKEKYPHWRAEIKRKA